MNWGSAKSLPPLRSRQDEATRTHPAAELLAGVATLLFVNGQTTEGTRLAVKRLGAALGHEVRLVAGWGQLDLLCDGALSGSMADAEPLAVDIGRVVATERIIDEVCAGRAGAAEGLAALQSVGRLPPVSLARFAGMAAAGAAALGLIFGAADAWTLALIAAGAGAGACLRRAVSRVTSNPFAPPLLAAILAGAIGSAASALDLPVAHRLVAVCPCMVLVPGPHFLNGAIDLARARMALGMARIGFASLVVLAISAGLLAGLSLGAAGLAAGGSPPVVPLAYDVAAAGVAVAAYGSFFNMPWRMLPLPIGIGMAAHAVRWEMLRTGASIQGGAFGACLLVGVAVSVLAPRLRVPFGAFAFASVVSLMPGLFMFQVAGEALALLTPGITATPDIVLGLLRDATMATVILLAMTAGLIVPKMALDSLLGAGGASPAVRSGRDRCSPLAKPE